MNHDTKKRPKAQTLAVENFDGRTYTLATRDNGIYYAFCNGNRYRSLRTSDAQTAQNLFKKLMNNLRLGVTDDGTMRKVELEGIATNTLEVLRDCPKRKKKSRKGSGSSSQYEQMLWSMERLAPHLEGVAVRDLNQRWFNKTYNALSEKYSEATVTRTLRHLKQAIKMYAREHQLPLPELFESLGKEPSRRIVLTFEEYERIMFALDGNTVDKTTGIWSRVTAPKRLEELEMLKRFFLLLLWTGTRHNTVLQLSWSFNETSGFIDAEKGILWREGSLKKKSNKRAEPVILPPHLAQLAKAWRNRDVARNIDAVIYITSNQNYGKHRQSSMNASFKRLMDDAGITRNITPHALKHSLATILLNAGLPMSCVASYMSTSKKTLENTYHHVDDAMLQRPIGDWIAHLAADLSGDPPSSSPSGSNGYIEGQRLLLTLAQKASASIAASTA